MGLILIRYALQASVGYPALKTLAPKILAPTTAILDDIARRVT